MKNFDPQVGQQCHWVLYTDVEPVTVISRTPKKVVVRVDSAEIDTPPVIVPGGFAGHCVKQATWKISENPDGRLLTFTLRKNGHWKQVGTGSKERGNYIGPDWFKFHDYNF